MNIDKTPNINKTPQIIENSIICPDGTYMRSYYRYDYKTHLDLVTNEVYMIDGGCTYLRRSVNKVPAIESSVFLDSAFSLVRKAFVWKSYGKNNEHAPDGIYISLIDMSTEHIEAILSTESHIKGTYVSELLSHELFVRAHVGVSPCIKDKE